jgi:LysM repeat protein
MRSLILVILAMVFSVVTLSGATYTVKLGDTLKSIAEANGVKVEQLAEANDIEPPYVLWVGLELIITADKAVMTYSTEDGESLLLPTSWARHDPTRVPTGNNQFLFWNREFSATFGGGRFWNNSGNGFFRYASVSKKPLTIGKMNIGLSLEINDNACEFGNYSQTGQGFKTGVVSEVCSSGRWFSYLGLKGLYGFNQTVGKTNGSWSKTQENQIWVGDLWVDVHRRPNGGWFSKTSLSGTYTGLITAEAIGGELGQIKVLEPYSPTMFNGYLEQSIYQKDCGVFVRSGFRYLNGEKTEQNRYFEGIGLVLWKATVFYELETDNNNKQINQKIEAEISF